MLLSVTYLISTPLTLGAITPLFPQPPTVINKHTHVCVKLIPYYHLIMKPELRFSVRGRFLNLDFRMTRNLNILQVTASALSFKSHHRLLGFPLLSS